VTASFVQQFALATATAGGGSGSVALSPPGGLYDVGTVVTVTANANAGSAFTGWSGDLSGTTNPETVTMDADKSVTASFALDQVTLSVATTGTGTGSVSLDPPGGSYAPGAVVTLTASADPGSGFTAWSGDLTGSVNPETIVMSANRSVTADFSVLPQCSDGLDNDGDTLTDYPADPGCQNETTNDESPACSDGVDNDGDGGTDFDGVPPDPECNQAWQRRENPDAAKCGFGLELALVLPPLVWLRGRRRKSREPSHAKPVHAPPTA
jgi:uncharacterized repeat protein (TIGR02543 family)